MAEKPSLRSFISKDTGKIRKNGKTASLLGRKGTVGRPSKETIAQYIHSLTTGRPSKLTAEIVTVIKQSGLNDLNKKQTAYQCGITYDTLRVWFTEFPELENIWKDSKSRNAVRAKMNVAQSIDSGDINTSKWYLEKTQGDEFSTKQNIVTEEKKVVPFGNVGK